MFGKRKDLLGDALRGAVKPVVQTKAPQLEFRAGGLQPRVDLRQHCSPVVDQRPLGSCAACSTVGAFELLSRRTGRGNEQLSILFLYFTGRQILGATQYDIGMLASMAPAAVMAYGICEEKYWPYRADKHTETPPQEAFANARKHDATQYARIGSTAAAKASLSGGVPVMFGSDIPRDYYEAAANDSKGRMPEWGSIDGGPDTGHAMLLVGYDDADKTWLVRNSLGTEFGEGGYIRVPYSVFDARVWDEDMWAIGELERVGNSKLVGASVTEAVEHVRAFGPSEYRSALDGMREEIARDFSDHADDTKSSIRDRLRRREQDLERKRNRDGD